MPDHYPDTTNKGISASKFMGGSPVLGKESNVGKLANITRRVTFRLGKVENLSALNAEKITKLKDIAKLRKENVDNKLSGSSSGLLNSLNGINENVNGMLSILSDRQRFETKRTVDERKRREQEKRGKAENKLEDSFKGIQKIATSVLAPAISLWQRLWDFVKTLIFGKFALKLFDWLTDKNNQKKVQALGRFFKDWWPAMLTGYVLFGTGMGRFIIWMGTSLVSWGATLIKTVIPALMKALAAMGPLGWVTLGVGAVGISSWMLMRNSEESAENVLEEQGLEDASTEEQTEALISPGGLLGTFTGTINQDARGGGDKQQPEQTKMNQGGFVSGPPGKDRVPAKLTAGEFVMSKGAVDTYGAGTLAGMNAAAGGTNMPRGGGYFGGGEVIQSNAKEEELIKSGKIYPPIVKPGTINSYADAIRAGVKIEDNIMGSMRSGNLRWTEKLRKGLFGKQKYVNMGTKWINQGFGEDHNKVLEMPTRDFVNLTMGWSPSISSTGSSAGSKINRRGRKVPIPDKTKVNLGSTPSTSLKQPVSQPNKIKSTVAYEQQKAKWEQQQIVMPPPDMRLPPINPSAMISRPKIAVLGISV